MKAGFMVLWGDANDLGYSKKIGSSGLNLLEGVMLEFSIPTKFENVDFIFGSIYAWSGDEISGPNYCNQFTVGKLNGGGVYAGLKPQFGGKHFGAHFSVAAGILPFKKFHARYDEYYTPPIDYYDLQTSFLGGVSSLGI